MYLQSSKTFKWNNSGEKLTTFYPHKAKICLSDWFMLTLSALSLPKLQYPINIIGLYPVVPTERYNSRLCLCVSADLITLDVCLMVFVSPSVMLVSKPAHLTCTLSSSSCFSTVFPLQDFLWFLNSAPVGVSSHGNISAALTLFLSTDQAESSSGRGAVTSHTKKELTTHRQQRQQAKRRVAQVKIQQVSW